MGIDEHQQLLMGVSQPMDEEAGRSEDEGEAKSEEEPAKE